MSNGLPKNWVYKHKAYYYKVPLKQRENFGCSWYPLGKTISEAYRKYADIVEVDSTYRTMQNVIDRYMREVSPTKSTDVHENEWSIAGRLSGVFGEMPPHAIRPKHVHGYLDYRRNTPVSANRDIKLLSHMFSKCIRWGILENNPCTGKKIEYFKEYPRDRYVNDEEFYVFYNEYCSPFLQAYLAVKLITGQRQRDVLDIRLSDISDEGIYFATNKSRGRKKFIMEITPELQDAIKQAKSIKRKVGTLFLFASKFGTKYKSSGFQSIWQRAMKSYCADGGLRFTEHDIRAKTASETDAVHANEMMQHNSQALTNKIYRRKLSVVQPLRKKK